MRIITFIILAFSTITLQAQDSETKTLERGDFMKFEIVNMKPKVIHAYVKGPKRNGGHFSYGLNIAPFVKRKENWTVGTKLYAVNVLGIKKLLYEFTAADEGQVVNVNK